MDIEDITTHQSEEGTHQIKAPTLRD